MSFFPEVPARIPFEPGSRNPLVFKHYDADFEVEGRSMKDWLRFSVCYWHTFRGTGSDPFGAATMVRPWEDGTDSLDNAKHRVDVAFEFITKLGCPFYCFHDRDVAPEGSTLAESNRNLDVIVEKLKEKQEVTGVQLLWGTANLFSHPRYMHGAATSPNADVFAYAAAQVKKAMEATHELGGANYVLWGGREGYFTLFNTNMKRELDHLAQFMRMVADYAKSIGFSGQLLIEPKPMEPLKHQYDYDVAGCLHFLRSYGLQDDFKLNIENNHAALSGHTIMHELTVAAANGALGSIDLNKSDLHHGWDTDKFSFDDRIATLMLLVIMDQGGLAPGGTNWDAKVRRESFEPIDLFYAHIGSMDTFAHGLKIAAAIRKDGLLSDFVKNRYSSYDDGIGKNIEAGTTSFAELESYMLEKGNPDANASGRQEMLENLINAYL